MTYKIKKMINNGTEYKIGSIDSSNDTYADIVHLTQEQYDALENPDPDTLYSTPDNVESGEFAPENEGETGQVLTKTETGYGWGTYPNGFTPESSGSDGQILKKTSTGYDWGIEALSLVDSGEISIQGPRSSGNVYSEYISAYNFPALIVVMNEIGALCFIGQDPSNGYEAYSQGVGIASKRVNKNRFRIGMNVYSALAPGYDTLVEYKYYVYKLNLPS